MPTNGKPKTSKTSSTVRVSTPLAETPQFPKEKASKAGQREQAMEADMKKYGYVTDATAKKYKK